MHLPRRLCALTVAILLMTGCDRAADEPDGGDGDAVPWPATGTAAARDDGLVWASAGRIHLGDGSVIDVGGSVDGYVVAGDGIVAMGVGAESETHPGYVYDGAEATYVGADGSSFPLGFEAINLAASADGRYLAAVDASSGLRIDEDLHVLEVVVVDLTDGTEVVRTSDGLGDPGRDDLGALYPELSFQLGFDPEAGELLYASGFDELLEIDVSTGDVELVGPDEAVAQGERHGLRQSRWGVGDRRWRREPGSDVARRHGGAASAGGALESGRVGLGLYGRRVLHVHGGPSETVLMSCVVPEGVCTSYEDSANQEVTLPLGIGPGGRWRLDEELR